MKKTLTAVVVAMFALTSAAFAAEGMNTSTETPAAKTTVKKHKKAKKSKKKGKKEEKKEEGAAPATGATEAAPAAGGAAHQ